MTNLGKCAKGYAFKSLDVQNKTKICEKCPPGTYKSSVSDSGCTGLCPLNSTSFLGSQNSKQCYCLENFYHVSGGTCLPCPEGSICKGGLVPYAMEKGYDSDFEITSDHHTKPIAMEGYYLDKLKNTLDVSDDWKFIKCPIEGSCLGKDECLDSMEHYLCAECKFGYTNNFNKGERCTPCPATSVNIGIQFAWYLALLLFNIVIACLNVSAGFNRRSIHSVVIKIALNYCTCMSVLNVINYNEISLPIQVTNIINAWSRKFSSSKRMYLMSMDCLIRNHYNVSHADSFFYSMMAFALLPIVLIISVTILMWIILNLIKIKKHKTIKSKILLLYQAKSHGLDALASRLIHKYSNERLFLIFRYISLPGQNGFVKFLHFLDDMIPIYVTVLFSIHGTITSNMLSLLDCTYINLGKSVPGKYVLRPAMSVQCSIDPSKGYIPYLLLGLGGLLIWGLGIPLISFLVLFTNRKRLHSADIRRKYGFLHNGYERSYWFWESVVFARKCLVLVIGSIVIVPSNKLSESRIWLAQGVALTFLILNLIYQPFDKRYQIL